MRSRARPRTVRKYIAHEIAETGINYYVCDFAFGTISHEEALRSTELFAKEVMPGFSPSPQPALRERGEGGTRAAGEPAPERIRG